MKSIIEQYMLVYGMIVLGIIGIVLKVFVSGVYNHLIHASDKMGNSDNKLMKLIKLKFETCYQLRIGVHNVESFVDKYVYRYRVMGVLLTTWENLSGQVLILSMLYGTAIVVSAIVTGVSQEVLFIHFFTAIAVCAVLVLMDSINNLSVKRKRLQINIVDYLDNYLKIRLENEMIKTENTEDSQIASTTENGTEDSRNAATTENGTEGSRNAATTETGKEDSQIAATAEKSADTVLDRTMDAGMEELLNSLLDTADAKKRSRQEKEKKENAVIAEVLGEYFV